MIPFILFIIIQRWPPKITKHNPTRPNLDSSTYWDSTQHVPPYLWCPWPRWHHGPCLQLSSTKPKQIQPSPTKSNHTQINSNKFNNPTSTKLNPTKPRPSQTQSNRTKPNQTQPHLNRFNRTQSNPTYRAKPNQIHQDITQSYTSLNSPTQPGTTFDHPTRQRLHTALRNPAKLKQCVWVYCLLW